MAPEFEYEIAVSYASEDLEFVRGVKRCLEMCGIRVWMIDKTSVEHWGRDLAEYLEDVFVRRARFVLLFLSADYCRKVWPTYERRMALPRALLERSECLLPVVMDDTPVPGPLKNLGYIDYRKLSGFDLVDLIVKKVTGEPSNVRARRRARLALNGRVRALRPRGHARVVVKRCPLRESRARRAARFPEYRGQKTSGRRTRPSARHHVTRTKMAMRQEGLEQRKWD